MSDLDKKGKCVKCNDYVSLVNDNHVSMYVDHKKARESAKKADGTALTLTTQENAIKNTFDNRFAIPLDFDFF